ncbi:membrane protein [Klebsiella phage K64-1]|uniref:membrane protein n=1 Tax=Klebsiella phage K64-1 TaxID=1439894 RepID=UPI00248BADB9|nr:membrane protein [Klebsiella phage K64-1]
MMEYINLFDTSFIIVSTYYICSTIFYFLMWFFKRKLDNFIKQYSLQLVLQLYYWIGFGLMYLHYYFVLYNIRENNTFMLYMLQIIGTAIYVGYLMSIVLSKLRNKIPDMRN